MFEPTALQVKAAITAACLFNTGASRRDMRNALIAAHEAGLMSTQAGQEPVMFISEQQMPLLGKAPYFAYRKTAEGLFQFPLYAAPPPAPEFKAVQS
jgi:hypothetical protein